MTWKINSFKEDIHTLIQQHKQRVSNIDRQSLLTRGTKRDKLIRIPFVSTYGETSGQVSRIIKRHWSIISKSYPSITEFNVPPLMSYRRSRNLRDRLVKSIVPVPPKIRQTYLSTQKQGCFPCLTCVACKSLQKGPVFIHPTTNEAFRITQYLTCDTEWVVYALWCPCGLLYIGETKNIRLTNHRYCIRKKRLDLPVSKHFFESGHTERDICCMILEHVTPPSRGGDRLTILKKRELTWIFKCNTLKPYGLNVDFKVTNNTI